VIERTAALEAANAAIRDAARRKDEFLAMLAHELRNPLAAIAGADCALAEVAPPDPRTTRFRTIISRQTEHLCRLVDDLLDLSRITSGKIDLRKAPVDVAAVIQRAVDGVASLMEANQHRLSVSLPPAPLWLVADATRLEQVLANLLHNAAKYTEPGGQIRLTVEREECLSTARDNRDGARLTAGRNRRSRRGSREGARQPASWAILTVSDSGIGIAPELLPHVFDMFIQSDRALDRSQGGLGIGLSLVRSLSGCTAER